MLTLFCGDVLSDLDGQIKSELTTLFPFVIFEQTGYRVFLGRCQNKLKEDCWEARMKQTPEPSKTSLYGIASLFDDFERKELFKKYLFFLGWLEVLIFAACWIFQLGFEGPEQSGSTIFNFPWKAYFLIAFLAPVAITFIIGIVVVGFNQYFSETGKAVERSAPEELEGPQTEASGRLATLLRVADWVHKLPFLALLLFLAVGVAFFYKLGDILAFVGNVGEMTVKIILFSAIGAVAVIAVFLLILIVLNFKLRKKSMDYQYRSEVAERFGIIILDDNTVLNSEGRLLINGKKAKGAVPLLPAKTADTTQPDHPPGGVLPRPADLEST
jgi:hypothetical protein